MSGGRDVQNGGQGFGGGEQGERLEGSLTDGGSVPGDEDEDDRRFGAGRAAEPGHTAPQGEGGGSLSGRGQEDSEPKVDGGEAGASGEQSGYGNTPQR